MNSILIVFPILTLLMFDLGLSLEFKDFYMVVKRPRAMLAGMLGQLVLLPVLAYLLVRMLGLEPAIAIPAIIYALMMNVVLLIYVGVIRLRDKKS